MPNAVGTQPHQIPTCGDLGSSAFIDADRLPVSVPQAAAIAPLAYCYITTLFPASVAQIDALTIFSSGYNTYQLVGEGITFASDDGLSMRMAVAGAADAGNNYFLPNGTETTTAQGILPITNVATVRAAGKGLNFSLWIENCNDSVRLKGVRISSRWQSTTGATPGCNSFNGDCVYLAAGVVTGFRLLSTLGANFAPTGAIRIYGVRNSNA